MVLGFYVVDGHIPIAQVILPLSVECPPPGFEQRVVATQELGPLADGVNLILANLGLPLSIDGVEISIEEKWDMCCSDTNFFPQVPLSPSESGHWEEDVTGRVILAARDLPVAGPSVRFPQGSRNTHVLGLGDGYYLLQLGITATAELTLNGTLSSETDRCEGVLCRSGSVGGGAGLEFEAGASASFNYTGGMIGFDIEAISVSGSANASVESVCAVPPSEDLCLSLSAGPVEATFLQVEFGIFEFSGIQATVFPQVQTQRCF